MPSRRIYSSDGTSETTYQDPDSVGGRKLMWMTGSHYDYPAILGTDGLWMVYPNMSLKTLGGLWNNLDALKPFKDTRYKRFGRRKWIPDEIDFFTEHKDDDGKRFRLCIDCLEDEMPLKTVNFLIRRDRNLKLIKGNRDIWS